MTPEALDKAHAKYADALENTTRAHANEMGTYYQDLLLQVAQTAKSPEDFLGILKAAKPKWMKQTLEVMAKQIKKVNGIADEFAQSAIGFHSSNEEGGAGLPEGTEATDVVPKRGGQ